jgi:hypothetical protein
MYVQLKGCTEVGLGVGRAQGLTLGAKLKESPRKLRNHKK